MNVTIETHDSKIKANRARMAYVRAQEMVDAVYERLFGQPMFPKAEDCYFVEKSGDVWVVSFTEQSFEALDGLHD